VNARKFKKEFLLTGRRSAQNPKGGKLESAHEKAPEETYQLYS
jgi:hypothetical protein